MNGWIKIFSDRTREYGLDEDVAKRKASWSKGRLTDMVGAEIAYGDSAIGIYGPGEYWQSDDYEASLMVKGSGELVMRRLQRKGPGIFHVMLTLDGIGTPMTIEPEEEDMWFTLEFNCKTKTFVRYYSEDRI